MGENTKIELAEHVWSPWLGRAGRRRKTSRTYWRNPLKWNRQADVAYLRYLADVEQATCEGGDSPPEEYHRPRVLVGSIRDPFEGWTGAIVDAQGSVGWRYDPNDGTVFKPSALDPIIHGCRYLTMDDIRRDLFGLIDQTQNLDWLLATKRPENILRFWPMTPGIPNHLADADPATRRPTEYMHRPNVHLLYSASDQDTLEAGIGHLLKCRDLTPVLGLSLEPLVGPIDDIFCDTQSWQCPYCGDRNVEADIHTSEGNCWYCHDCRAGAMNDVEPLVKFTTEIGWVLVGGESGPSARPCDLAWILDIVQQCKAAGVAVWVKQDSGPKPGQQGRIPDDIWAIKELPQIPKVQRG